MLFTVNRTTLEHQVLSYFTHMSLYVKEGPQRIRFLTHQKIKSKTLALDNWNFSWSTHVLVQEVLVVYWSNLLEKKNSITYLTHYLDNMCVLTIVYCNFPYASPFAMWIFYFLIDYSFCTSDHIRLKSFSNS